MRTLFRASAALAFLAITMLAPSFAHADGTISNPGDHDRYRVEIEPELLLGWNSVYVSGGFAAGVGARASIPIIQNGFIPDINNNVAISFGADLLHFGGCYFTGVSCSANYLFFPVAGQWNFYLTPRWSVFAEAGAVVYKGFFDTCPRGLACSSPTEFGATPAFGVGARYHLNRSFSLTGRIGYPSAAIGVSFFQ